MADHWDKARPYPDRSDECRRMSELSTPPLADHIAARGTVHKTPAPRARIVLGSQKKYP
jgi:hypothetical protein